MGAATTSRPSQRQLTPILLLVLAAALTAYFFWTRVSGGPTEPAGSGLEAPAEPAPSTVTGPRPAEAGRYYAGEGIEVDANGARILNEAGLPRSAQPLPVAKPIPIKAPPTATIGYSQDAQGVVKPVRAGELAVVPNSPGNYTVVDMWADGGPAVVPATRGTPVSAEELARMREAEAKAERSRR